MTIDTKYKIGVYGSHRIKTISPKTLEWSFLFGKEVAMNNHILVTGGADGVSRKCREGCNEMRGIHIGILPNESYRIKGAINSLNLEVISNLGEIGRIPLLANSVDFAFAISGGSGTLAEIIMTYLQKKTVFVVNGLQRKNDPDISLLLNRTNEILVNGVKLTSGWLDSKPSSLAIPIYIINEPILPKAAFEIGLQIFQNSHQ